MFPFDPARVQANVRQASTEDLLDRLTVYRAGMEPQAVEVITEELRSRGVSAAAIADHADQRAASTIPLPDGTAVCCTFCNRPAVVQAWGWHRLLGKLPVFPRRLAYCSVHRPAHEPLK